MRTQHRLRASTYVASGNDTIPLSGLPSGSIGNMVPYLTAIELLCDIAGTVGASNVTAQQWRNLLAGITVNVPGGPWGPVALNGEQLEILRFTQGGEALSYASDASGDALANSGAGAVTRKVRHVYSFEELGHPMSPWDFCPPSAAFRDGNIQLSFSALPTNFTAPTITFYTIAHIVWRTEADSVPRVRSIAKALVGANETIPESGLMVRLALHNKTADAVAGDFTGFRLWKDGFQILEINRPLDLRSVDYSGQVGKVSSAFLQETFADPIGGNFVRGINVYPIRGARIPLGDLPTGDMWRYDFDGAPTLANWEVLYTIAYRQDGQHVKTVLGSCGCDAGDLMTKTAGGKPIPSSKVLVPRGPSGAVLNSHRLSGFTRTTAVSRGSGLHAAALATGILK